MCLKADAVVPVRPRDQRDRHEVRHVDDRLLAPDHRSPHVRAILVEECPLRELAISSHGNGNALRERRKIFCSGVYFFASGLRPFLRSLHANKCRGLMRFYG